MVVLAAGQAATGMWAATWPSSFFATFPGFGLRWVSGDGLYNEHLTRDVGGLSLALAVLTMAVLRTGGPTGGGWLAAAWELYAAPHLVFHVAHLSHLDRLADQVSSVTALSFSVVVPLSYALAQHRERAASRSRR
jgi:hypothetical protein